MNFWNNCKYLLCTMLLWCGGIVYALDADMGGSAISASIASSSGANRAYANIAIGVDASISGSTPNGTAQQDNTNAGTYAGHNTRVNVSSSTSNLLRSVAVLFTPPDSAAADAIVSAPFAAPDSTTASAGSAPVAPEPTTVDTAASAAPDSTTANSAASPGNLARHLHVELALTPEERQRGLMHRTSMDPNSGMLFVYSAPRELSFWMKDTSLALSIAFIGRDGTIISIADLEPFSLVSVPSAGEAQYALEVERGYFAQYGIMPGAQLALQECPTRIALLRHAPQKVASAVLRLCP